MKMSQFLILAALMVATAFAGELKQVSPSSKPAKVAVAPLPTLVFFMNPNGTPCQMQYKILQDGMKDLAKFANVRYVKTTEAADREAFYQYGIRSLPNLILVDNAGKEIVRFAPGIQEMDVIMKSIRK